MMARILGSDIWEVARAEYASSAESRREKSSSAVQEVDETMSFHEPSLRPDAYSAVPGRRARNLERSVALIGRKMAAGRSWSVFAATRYS